MNIISVTNIKWTDDTHTAVNCDIETSEFGLIAYTAAASDVESISVNLFNDIVSGLYGSIGEPNLDIIKSTQIFMLTESFNIEKYSPIAFTSSNGTTALYDADVNSINNISQTILGMQTSKTAPPGFFWVTNDNQRVPFTYQDVVNLGATIFARSAGLFVRLQEKKAAVRSALTSSIVHDILW